MEKNLLNYSNNFLAIIDLNNLYLAYYKSSLHKKTKPDALEYSKNLHENLKILQNQLIDGKIDVGNYNYFTIYEPKKRTICAASFAERVLHHAIMNVCHQTFERHLIFDSYATRIGKGTYKALERAKYFSKTYKYYLKLDIRKYFDSISHDILKTKLAKIFNDENILNFFNQIIDSYSTSRKFETSERFETNGLPIGNLTSQYFANFYLSSADHFIKEQLKAKYYVRYMDDMIIWHNNLDELKLIQNKFINFVSENLKLQFKINYINTTTHGLNFLSYRIFNNRTELQQKSKKRFIHKLKIYEQKLESNVFTQTDFRNHCIPLVAFTQHASTKGFRSKIFDN